MITTRIAAAFAAGALAVGILVGSAGAILAREAIVPQASDWTAHMSQMGSMMSMMAGQGGMMNGQNGTGSTAPGGMMNGQNVTGPAASAMPDWMQQHHVTTSPVPAP